MRTLWLLPMVLCLRDGNHDGFGNLCDADFNDDGLVGVPDFLRIAAAWGSRPGDQAYDLLSDLDEDGTIGGFEYLAS